MPNVDRVDGASFAATVLASPKPVLVDFTADWCAPCRMVAPVLAQLAEERADQLRIVSVDVDREPELAMRYRVSGLPTMVLFVGGEAVTTVVGARPKAAIVQQLEPHL